jgi:hypothetical protein
MISSSQLITMILTALATNLLLYLFMDRNVLGLQPAKQSLNERKTEALLDTVKHLRRSY